MSRYKNASWDLPDTASIETASLAVLMDIRDELQAMNRLLRCPNFTAIPHRLAEIQRNTTKPGKKKRAEKPKKK